MRHNRQTRSRSVQTYGWLWWTGVFGISLIIIGVLIVQSPGSGARDAADLYPQFTGTTLDKSHVSLGDLRGQVVLINFWATWCPPCRAEMPFIQAAFETYHQQGFTVLAVNNGESAAVVQAFADRLHLTFPVILDPDASIQRRFQIDSYPTSLFIDRNGIVYATHTGALSQAQLVSAIGTGFGRGRN